MNRAYAMLIWLLLLLPMTLPLQDVSISLSKEQFGIREPLGFSVSSGETPASVMITDPNGYLVMLDGCIGTCEYVFTPVAMVEGAYLIAAGSDGRWVEQTAMVGQFESMAIPGSANQTAIPLTEEAAPESEEAIGGNDGVETEIIESTDDVLTEMDYVFVDIEAYLNEEMEQEEGESALITAMRKGMTVSISVHAAFGEEKILITVTDSLGRLYVLNAKWAGDAYEIALPTLSEYLIVSYAGWTTHLDVRFPAARQPGSNARDILTLLDSKGREVAATARALSKANEQIDLETISEPDMLEKIDVEIEPIGMIIERITIKDTTAEALATGNLKIEDVPLTILPGARAAYAIDPTGLAFIEMEIEAVATAQVLWKCVDYDFESQDCFGEWAIARRMVPGERYTYTLTPEDPVFAELDETFVTDDCYVVSNQANTVFNTAVLQVRNRANMRHRTYMRWDISGLPNDIHIQNANLSLYLSANGATAEASIHHVYDHTWGGITESTMTWNNQVCGGNDMNGLVCNTTSEDTRATTAIGWVTWNITQMLQREVDAGNNNLSVLLRTPETLAQIRDAFHSKEASSAFLPVMRMSYIYYPNVTLISPADGGQAYSSFVSLNFSVSDDTLLLDCSLYGNFTGSFMRNTTISGVQNGTISGFSITLPLGSYLWNVRCNDTDGLASFATGNHTLSVVSPSVSANQSSYITRQTLRTDLEIFPPDTNLTLIIKDPQGAFVSGYPKSFITTGTGTYTDQWHIPISASDGTYTIMAYQTDDPRVNGSVNTLIYGLAALTDKMTYATGETVSIASGRFTPGSSVTLRIIDPSLSLVGSYPKTETANLSGHIEDSWIIPGGSLLGAYRLNVTEDSYPERSAETGFTVTSAVVHADQKSYEQGDMVNITGYAWSSGATVTVEIKDGTGMTVYLNDITANASGHIEDIYQLMFDTWVGNYSLGAIEPAMQTKNGSTQFNVTRRVAEAGTEREWYKEGEIATISGRRFSPGSTVNLSITSAGSDLAGYPATVTSNSSGGFDTSLAITGLPTGDYMVSASDISYPNLNSTSEFRVVISSIQISKAAYGIGETVSVSGSYWNRSGEVMITVSNMTGDVVYSSSQATDADGSFTHLFAAPDLSAAEETFSINVSDQWLDDSKVASFKVADTLPPSVTALSPAAGTPYTGGDEVAISSHVADNHQVLLVEALVEWEGGWKKIVLKDTDLDSVYNSTFIAYYPGRNNVTIIARDAADNVNASETTWFETTHNTDAALYCTTSPCIASTAMIGGRDSITGGAEPNQPNTIDICTDGTSGTYMSDESLENITFTSLNGTEFRGGDTIEVTITGYCWGTGADDNFNFVYANSTSTISWKVVDFVDPCPGGGFQTVTRRFTLDRNPGVQAFRGILQYNGNTAATCGGGGYDDNDDIEFLVMEPRERDNPLVTILAPSYNQSVNYSDPVQIRVNITDASEIRHAIARITKGINQWTVALNDYTLDGIYTGTFTSTQFIGDYHVRILSNDSFGNRNDSQVTLFHVVDTGSLAVTPLGCEPPNPTQGMGVTCSASITDESVLIADVLANVTYPNGTTEEMNVQQDGSTYSFDFTQTGDIGLFIVTWQANNTNGISRTALDSFRTYEYNIPSVIITAPSPGRKYNTSVPVMINATITDDTAIFNAYAMISGPDLSIQHVMLANTNGDEYYGSFTNATKIGAYQIVIIGNDTSGNMNSSEQTWINVTYSAKGAVFCTTSPCIASTAMIGGRDSITGGPEPNQPNTIDTCTDGTSGSYLNDESLENITFTSLNGSEFRGGDLVEASITVYCYDGTNDNVNFIYTNSSTDIEWRVEDYVDPCPSVGLNTFTRQFTLDRNTGIHAFRGSIQYQGTIATTCGGGGYDDNDDIEFLVLAPREKNPPSVIITSPSYTNFTVDSQILIRATITDETEVMSAIANFTNRTHHDQIVLTHQGSAVYLGNYPGTNATGLYNITIIAMDIFNNTNASEWVSVNITERNIIGTAGSIAQDGSSELSLIIEDSPAQYGGYYSGTMNISVYNGSERIVMFTHDFDSGPLDLTTMTIMYRNKSIAVDIGKEDVVLFVPLVDQYCNVLICPGVLERDLCGIDSYTSYPEPIEGYCRVTVNGTWAQDAPDQTDFLIHPEDLLLPRRQMIEGQTVSINATITNDGNTEVADLEVEFYDLTQDTRIALFTIDYMAPKSTHTFTDVPWTAVLGNTTIEVRVDPSNHYTEYDETNNNVSKQFNVSIWHVFYGEVTSNKTIGSGEYDAYVWELIEQAGNVYFAGGGRQIDFSNLMGLGRTSAGAEASLDFLEADLALGTENATDSIWRSYTEDGSSPLRTMTVPNVERRDLLNVAYDNSTNSSDFVTGILWDMTRDTNGEFDQTDTEDLVFVTRINRGMQGRYGVYDYEIKVPALLREYNGAEGYLNVYASLD